MKCQACDVLLSDQEATAKSAATGDYVDLCGKCLEGTGIVVVKNPSLKDNHDEEEYIPDFYDEVGGG